MTPTSVTFVSAPPVGTAGNQPRPVSGSRTAKVLPCPGSESITSRPRWRLRSEEHTSELQSLMRKSYAVLCLKKKKKNTEYVNYKNHKEDHIIIRSIKHKHQRH